MSDTLLQIVLLVPCLVIAIVFHEVAHGWAALALGDPTAKERRRLTLNPIRHVDPVGTLLVPGALALFGGPVFGWAKPVPVNFNRLRNPRLGMMLVAAAGPAMNLLLATIAAVALGLWAGSLTLAPAGPSEYLFAGLQLFILINVFLALFNLLPIPPFDGSHIVEGLMPRSMARSYERLRPLGFPLILILLIVLPWLIPSFDPVGRVVVPPVEWVAERYLDLTRTVAGY